MTTQLSTETPTVPASQASDRLSTVFFGAARCCGARLGADRIGIFELVHGEANLRALVAATSPESIAAPPAATLIPSAGTMAAYALATGNAVISPDLDAEQRFDDRFLRQQAIRSGLVLPVRLEHEPICLLGMFRSTTHDFALDEVLQVERVGEALARLAEASGWPATGDGSAAISQEEGLRAMEELQGHLAAAEQSEQHLAAMLEGRTGPECRSSPRHQYPYCQKIAPVYGDRMPAWEEFVEVYCGDLSGGGISIWLSEQPSFRDLIVALGRPPAVAHFAARVVHSRKVRRNGRTLYQVGCRFMRRVYL